MGSLDKQAERLATLSTETEAKRTRLMGLMGLAQAGAMARSCT